MHRNRIILCAILTRLCFLIIQYSVNALIPDHDAHVFIYPQHNNSTGVYDEVINATFRGLLRWDAQYFMHIAKYGYTHENTLAFFPLYPLIGRIIATLFRSVFSVFNEDSSLLLTFVCFNTFVFVKAALMLYDLSNLVLNADLAYKSAILFCINPASIFFVAPYSETLFSYLCFKCMRNCLVIYDKQSKRSRSIMHIVLPLSLSTCVRSNGILNIGFLSFFIVRECIRSMIFQNGFKKKLFNCLHQTFLLISCIYLCLIPFVFVQFYHYQLFCTDFHHNLPDFLIDYINLHKLVLPGMVSQYKQSWCFDQIPLAYSYIQKHYWNVGFLNYFEFKQIPNFLLATPIVTFILYNGARFIIMHKQYCLNLGMFNFKFKFINCNKIKPCVASIFRPNIFVFVVHGMFLVLFCFFCAHVQITTRMLCSASPLIYWFAAFHFHAVKEHGPNLRNLFLFNKLNNVQKMIFYYFVSYAIIGTVMFSNFLPWT